MELELRGLKFTRREEFTSRTKLNEWLKTAVGTIHITRTQYGTWIVYKPVQYVGGEKK